jgi:hypothetical protein
MHRKRPPALNSSSSSSTTRLKPPAEVGAGPYGTRLFFELGEGEVNGERLSGRLLPGGADWMLVGPDGWARVDVRAGIETHDNAVVYLSFQGLVVMRPRRRRSPRAARPCGTITTSAHRPVSRPAMPATPG